MALVKLGGGVTDIRGSIGGTTFSRCQGGNYMRARTKPTNPRSTLQTARRANVGYLTKYWSNDLVEQDRDDWRAYAAGTTWHNKLGEAIEINGLAAFLRTNALAALQAVPAIVGPPTAMGHAGGVQFTFLAESDTSKLQVAEPTGAWVNTEATNVLFFSAGLPTEAGQLAIPKGFRHIAALPGITPGGQVWPYELDAPYTMALGQRVTMSAMFMDANFRISGPHIASVLAAAAIP